MEYSLIICNHITTKYDVSIEKSHCFHGIPKHGIIDGTFGEKEEAQKMEAPGI